MANIQIDIAENGTTTLATAGKYCDRNIDVNVNVASGGGGDTSIEDWLVSGEGCPTEYTNDRVTSIKWNSFASQMELTSVSFPEVTYIDEGAFDNCSKLANVYFPKAEFIGMSAFNFTTQLKSADFPRVTQILPMAFFMSGIRTLILRSPTVCQNNGADIPGACIIYVPDSLVDSYKTATNWAQHASNIKPISELEG